MLKSMKFMASAAVLTSALSFPALSQVAPQTFAQMNVDQKALSTGYRTSKMIGSGVINQAGETIGTIDDLIINPSDKVPFAVLSVGGFLGIGDKFVVVSYSRFEIVDQKMMLRDASKESLKALPEFKYSK